MAGKTHLDTHIRLSDVRVGNLGPLSMEVYKGELVAIMGVARDGNPHILRMIAGLAQPDSGEILVSGAKVTGPLQEAGFVFREPVLLNSRTALRNVLLQLELRGKPSASSEHRARELLALIGAADMANRRAAQFAATDAVRVAICRALVHTPSVLFLDDPFVCLAPLDREQLAMDLQRVLAEDRPTTVLVTSSVQEAVQLADRVAVISANWRNLRFLRVDLGRPRRLDRMTTPAIAELCGAVRMTIDAVGGIL